MVGGSVQSMCNEIDTLVSARTAAKGQPGSSCVTAQSSHSLVLSRVSAAQAKKQACSASQAESIQEHDGGNSNILVIFSIAVIFKVQLVNSYFNQLKKYKLH